MTTKCRKTEQNWLSKFASQFITHNQFYFRALACSFILIQALLTLSCTKKSATDANQNPVSTSTDSAVIAKAELINKGRRSYLSNCTACHNSDPKRDGSIGPSVFGSNFELLSTRLMKAEYPAGYSPKRASKVMVAMPHLQADLEALHAYLNASDG